MVSSMRETSTHHTDACAIVHLFPFSSCAATHKRIEGSSTHACDARVVKGSTSKSQVFTGVRGTTGHQCKCFAKGKRGNSQDGERLTV